MAPAPVAAAAVAIPPAAGGEPNRRQVARGFCRVGHSFFLLARELTYSEHVCLGLVLDSTVGWQRDRAPIGMEQFADVANVSAAFVRSSLERLRERGLISWTVGGTGDRMYSISALGLFPAGRDERGAVAHGKCGVCGAIGEVDLEPDEFLQVPHAFFRKLPGACTFGEWAIVGALMALIGWRRDRAEVTNRELREVTGLSERHVQEALESCETKGLIGSDIPDRSIRPGRGRGITYWVVPAAFGAMQARVARTVCRDRRERSEERANTEAKDCAEVVGKATDTPAAESQPRRQFARCRACGQVSLVTLCKPEVRLDPGRRPVNRAETVSHGPPGEPSAGSVRQIAGLEEYLWQWADVLRSPVSAEIAGQIAGALGQASLSDFAERCARRRRYIETSGQSFRVFVALARDCAKVAARAAEAAALRGPRVERERDIQRDILAEMDREDAAWWLARDDVTAADRAELLARWPDLEAR